MGSPTNSPKNTSTCHMCFLFLKYIHQPLVHCGELAEMLTTDDKHLSAACTADKRAQAASLTCQAGAQRQKGRKHRSPAEQRGPHPGRSCDDWQVTRRPTAAGGIAGGGGGDGGRSLPIIPPSPPALQGGGKDSELRNYGRENNVDDASDAATRAVPCSGRGIILFLPARKHVAHRWVADRSCRLLLSSRGGAKHVICDVSTLRSGRAAFRLCERWVTVWSLFELCISVFFWCFPLFILFYLFISSNTSNGDSNKVDEWMNESWHRWLQISNQYRGH